MASERPTSTASGSSSHWICRPSDAAITSAAASIGSMAGPARARLPAPSALLVRDPLGQGRAQRPEPAAHELPRQPVLFLQRVGAEGGVQLDQAGNRAIALGRLDDHAHGRGVRRRPVPAARASCVR